MNKRTREKRLPFIRIFFALLIVLCCQTTSRATPRQLVILHLSDLHGQLQPMTAVNNNKTVELGGISRIGAAVASIKKANPNSVLAVSTGDCLTGNFFYHFSGKATFSALQLVGIESRPSDRIVFTQRIPSASDPTHEMLLYDIRSNPLPYEIIAAIGPLHCVNIAPMT